MYIARSQFWTAIDNGTTFMFDSRDTWNVIYIARSNRGHPPTSPNTAPATKNHFYDWSSSHMKRYLQCAEQQRLPSSIIKYCACHEKWFSWLILVTYEMPFTMRGVREVAIQHHQILRLPRRMTPIVRRNFSKTGETSFTMRGRSEHDPSMKPSVHNPPRNRGYFSCSDHFLLKNTTFRTPAIIPNFTNCCACHEILRLPRKIALMIDPRHIWNVIYNARSNRVVTLQHHQILHLPRKVTRMIDPGHIWSVIYNARSNRGYPPTSPNIAPATKSCSHDWSWSHMKRY